MERLEFLNYATNKGKDIEFFQGRATSRQNQLNAVQKVKEIFKQSGYVVCKYSGEKIYNLNEARLLMIPVNEMDAYVVTVLKKNVDKFKEELNKPKSEHKDPGVVTKNIKWGDDCLVSLGLIENHYISLPLFYVQYPNEDLLSEKLEKQISNAVIAEKISEENAKGTTLEGLHTLKGNAPYTNYVYVHNSSIKVERTSEGIVIRLDFTPAKKTNGELSESFSVSGIIEHDQYVDSFKEKVEECGVSLIRFSAPENNGDHIYFVCNQCIFVNL